MRFLPVVLLSLLPSMAFGDPWQRDAGRGFLSLSTMGGSASFWLDRGLGNGRTLILSGFRSDRGELRLAARLGQAVPSGRHPHLFALSLGIEARQDPATGRDLRVVPGAAWGMGLTAPMPGWVSARATLSLGPDARRSDVEAKLDATLGLRPTPSLMAIVQLQTEHLDGRAHMHLAPSLVWEWRAGHHLEIGLRQPVVNGWDRQFKLGAWVHF